MRRFGSRNQNLSSSFYPSFLLLLHFSPSLYFFSSIYALFLLLLHSPPSTLYFFFSFILLHLLFITSPLLFLLLLHRSSVFLSLFPSSILIPLFPRPLFLLPLPPVALFRGRLCTKNYTDVDIPCTHFNSNRHTDIRIHAD